MIKALRIDERFIHGEIATRWCPFFNIERIIVANNEVINNNIQMKMLQMAVPNGVIMKACGINEAINILNDVRLEPYNTFVIVNNPKDALDILKSVSSIPFVIQGNYGMINPNGKKVIENCLLLDDNDIKYLKEIARIKSGSYYRILPDSQIKYLKDMF